MFENTEIITNSEYKKTVEEHLGKHPVIHLDFLGADVKSYTDAVQHCKKIVHQAFFEHKYLRKSKRLDDDEEGNADAQNFCRKWCSVEEYPKKTEEDVMNGLEKLAEYLHAHFGEKVYVLVDEFDAIYSSILQKKTFRNLDDIQQIDKLVTSMLIGVIKGNHSHVAGALITGVSYISSMGFSHLSNHLTIIRFLDAYKLGSEQDEDVAFYGGLEEEVKGIVEKLAKEGHLDNKFKQQEKFTTDGELDLGKILNVIKESYGGYYDQNKRQIYCLSSVLKFLSSGNVEYYCKEMNYITNLYLVCMKSFADDLQFLRKSNDPVKFCYLKHVSEKSVVRVYDMLLHDRKDVREDYDVIFSLLVDLGFLTYDYTDAKVTHCCRMFDNGESAKFTLPNGDIDNVFHEMAIKSMREYGRRRNWYEQNYFVV